MTQSEIAAMIAAAVQQALGGSQALKPSGVEFPVEAAKPSNRYENVEIQSGGKYIGYMVTSLRYDEKGKPKSEKPSYYVNVGLSKFGMKYGARMTGEHFQVVEFFHELWGADVGPEEMPVVEFLARCWSHPGATERRLAKGYTGSFPSDWIAILQG